MMVQMVNLGQRWVRTDLAANLSVAKNNYSVRSYRIMCIFLFKIASPFVNQATFELYIFSKVFHFSSIS